MAGVRRDCEVILPAANALEAGWVAGPRVRLAAHLRAVCEALSGGMSLPAAQACSAEPEAPPLDLADLHGEYGAKRALEVAAGGGHGLLMPELDDRTHIPRVAEDCHRPVSTR